MLCVENIKNWTDSEYKEREIVELEQPCKLTHKQREVFK